MQWRRLTPARDKYIVFPPGVDFSAVLAERGIGRIAWEPGELEAMQRAADGDLEMHEEEEEAVGAEPRTPKRTARKKSKSASESPAKARKKRQIEVEEEGEEEEEEAQVPRGTAQSAGEVEDAVAMDADEGEGEGEISLGAEMDVDADFSKVLKGKINGVRKVQDQEMDLDVDEEEGEEEEEHVGPSKTPVTKGPPSKRAAREKDAPAAEVPAKRRLVRRYTPRKTDDEVEEEEGVEPARDAVTTPSPVKRPAKTYGSSKSKRTPRGGKDTEIELPSATKKTQAMRRKAAPVEEDVEMAESSEEETSPPKPKVKAKETTKTVSARGAKAKEKEKEQPAAQTTKRKVIELPSSDSDSDSIDEEERSILTDLLPNRKGKPRANAASPTKVTAGHTPQRLNSVVVRTVADAYGSPTKVNGKVSPLKVGPPKKAAKSTAPPAPPAPATDEEDEPEPEPAPMRGSKAKKPARAASPAKSGPSTPPPPAAKAKTVRKAAENAEAGPSRASMSTTGAGSPSKSLRTPSRRSAATKATKRLHDVIMPDVVSFQKEMKKGTVRMSHEQEAATSATSAAKGKTPAKTPAKGKKRTSIGSEGVPGDEEEDEERMPERKKRKPNDVEAVPDTRGKRKAGGRKSTATESEEPEGQDRPPMKKAGTVAVMSNGATVEKNVRIMTTQLTLSEDVVRVSGLYFSMAC